MQIQIQREKMAHGGLLMVYSDTLTNFGKISSEGSKGAGANANTVFANTWRGSAGGGGSGRRKCKYIYQLCDKCRKFNSKTVAKVEM